MQVGQAPILDAAGEAVNAGTHLSGQWSCGAAILPLKGGALSAGEREGPPLARGALSAGEREGLPSEEKIRRSLDRRRRVRSRCYSSSFCPEPAF